MPNMNPVPSYLAQYERFLPIARDIPTSEVRAPRLDVSLAILNATRGVAAVLAHEADLTHLPGIRAADRADHSDGSSAAVRGRPGPRFRPRTSEIKAVLVSARRLRTALLLKADVLVIDGIVPAAAVAGMHKGHGPLATAGDCIALASLFHQHAAALQGHVSVSAEDIRAADELGRRLFATLAPTGAKRSANKELAAAMAARDRLWTLFQQHWETCVYRPGAWLFGAAVAAHVPPLGTRVRRKLG